jgi:tRNA A-37 threonylcarbamoyl transferase component Bud32/membrane-associated phospholipid phosphatase
MEREVRVADAVPAVPAVPAVAVPGQLGVPSAHHTGYIVRTRAHRRPSGEPPPLPRSLDTTGKYWLGLLALQPVLWVLLNIRSTRVLFDVLDARVAHWFAGIRSSELTSIARAMNSLGGSWTFRSLMWLTLIVCLVFRRFRHLLVYLAAIILTAAVVSTVETLLARGRPYGVVIVGTWTDYGYPSRAAAATCAGCLGLLYTAVPQGRLRQVGKAAATVAVLLLVLVRLYLGMDGVTDLFTGIVIGVTIPLVAFRLLCPNEIFPITYSKRRSAHLDVSGVRGVAITRALEDQLGVVVHAIAPFRLEGSAGSTPLRVQVKGDPESYLFAKLYAANHLRSDRWYKLWRTLLYGRLEAEARFMTVRQLVQYEDYALRLIRAAGVPSPEPYGIVEITPEREYLLVTEFVDGAVEIGDATVDDDVIDQGLRIVRKLWDAGLAHRDIKPSNLLARKGELSLIDPAFTEVRPTPWRQAVDLANMMLVLALFSSAEKVYERSIRFFTFEEIIEAFAATRGLTMPTQLRHEMRKRGRDLYKEFCRLLPAFRPIRIQRWSTRRITLTLGLVASVGAVVLIGLATLLSLGSVT